MIGLKERFERIFFNNRNLVFVIVASVIFICGIAVYSGIGNNVFVLDDFDSIVNNESIQNVSNIGKYFRSFFNRPFFYMSLALNYHFFGDGPASYHYVNLLIHIFNSVLLFLFVYRLNPLKNNQLNAFITAVLSGILFCIHPSQVFAVNHITVRSLLLCGMFGFLSLHFFLYAIDKRKKAFYCHIAMIISVIMFLCSLASKSVGISIPLIAAVILYSRKGDLKHTRLGERGAPYAYSLIFVLFVFFLLMLFIFGNVWQRSYYSFFSVLATQVRVVVSYLKVFLFPMGIVPEYDVEVRFHFFKTILSLTLLFIGGLGAYSCRRKKFYVLFGSFFFLLTILPSSSIIPRINTMLLYRTYIPFAGLCIVLSSFLCDMFLRLKPKDRMLLWGVPVLSFILFFGMYAYGYNTLFRSNYRLWTYIAERLPLSHIANYNAGTFAIKERSLFSEAIPYLEKASKLDPDFGKTFFHLGLAYHKSGELKNALKAYARAKDLSPDNYDYYVNYGNLFFALGKYEKAAVCYRIYLSKFEQSAPVFMNLYHAYQKLGNKKMAAASLKAARILEQKSKKTN